jgi:hypothetical protein
MLVAVRPTYGPALDRALDAWAVDPTSKGQHSVSLRAEEDVLLVDSSFQFSLLAWTLVMTGDHATLLRELHDLRAVPVIRTFRVNCPIASDIGWWLLCDRSIAGSEQHESEAEQKRLHAVVPHAFLLTASSARLGGIIDRQLGRRPESMFAKFVARWLRKVLVKPFSAGRTDVEDSFITNQLSPR